jgi:hypothetical protein
MTVHPLVEPALQQKCVAQTVTIPTDFEIRAMFLPRIALVECPDGGEVRRAGEAEQ